MYDGLRTRPRDAGGRRGRFRRVVVGSTRAVVWCVTSSSGNARPSRRDGSTPPAPARTFVFRGAKNGFERRLSSPGDFRTDRGVLGDGQCADGEAAVCLTTSGDMIRGVDVVGSSMLP